MKHSQDRRRSKQHDDSKGNKDRYTAFIYAEHSTARKTGELISEQRKRCISNGCFVTCVAFMILKVYSPFGSLTFVLLIIMLVLRLLFVYLERILAQITLHLECIAKEEDSYLEG